MSIGFHLDDIEKSYFDAHYFSKQKEEPPKSIYRVANLDRRICDCEPGAENTQTYREWIKLVYKDLYGLDFTDDGLNSMTDIELTSLINELEWLFWK